MINKKHRATKRVLHLAFMEACLLHYGLFKYRYLTHVFGVHEKEGIRVVADYKENGKTLLTTCNAGITYEETVKCTYLSRDTAPEHFLNLLYTLYGVESLEDL